MLEQGPLEVWWLREGEKYQSVKTASYIVGGSVMDYRRQDGLSSHEDVKAVRGLMLRCAKSSTPALRSWFQQARYI